MDKSFAHGFYASKRWMKCRTGFLASKNWTCERCGRMATIAHHKKRITPQNINNPEITLNWDNLEALCQTCHNDEHFSSGVCAKGLKFDTNGNLVKAPATSTLRSARVTGERGLKKLSMKNSYANATYSQIEVLKNGNDQDQGTG